MNEKVYSTSLTGAGFRLYEFKEVIKLIEENLSDKEIRTKVFEDNIFQQKSSSTTRSFPYILKRARTLDDNLRQWLLEETKDVGKIINFYALMKTDVLFFEFMDEVIRPKLQSNENIYENKDINIFFNKKAEQNEKLANWSESTLNRLKSSYTRLLIEMGYLNNTKSTELNRLFIDERVKDYLSTIGDKKYVAVMGG